jgi:transcriptional regulator with XRE-family HTH domain
MNLLDKTKFMLPLVRAHRSPREVADGAGVGFEWLKKFEAGDIEHPSVVRIQNLHDYLERTLTEAKETAA